MGLRGRDKGRWGLVSPRVKGRRPFPLAGGWASERKASGARRRRRPCPCDIRMGAAQCRVKVPEGAVPTARPSTQKGTRVVSDAVASDIV